MQSVSNRSAAGRRLRQHLYRRQESVGELQGVPILMGGWARQSLQRLLGRSLLAFLMLALIESRAVDKASSPSWRAAAFLPSLRAQLFCCTYPRSRCQSRASAAMLDDDGILTRELNYKYSAAVEHARRAPISPALRREKTLSRYVEVETWKNSELKDLQPVIAGIESACKGIATLVRRAQCDEIAGLHGSGGDLNVQGEAQKVMDVLANRILAASMCTAGKMDYVASEEEEEPTYCAAVLQNTAFSGEYAGVFDPLDGSSNIEAGLPVGTIFGIYRRPRLRPSVGLNPLEAIMQPGSQLLASGYCLYGGQTLLVLTLGDGVNGFTLDTSVGNFILTHPNLRVPDRGKIYAFNEGNSLRWSPEVQEFLRRLKTGEGEGNLPHTSRYIGAMVADVHRVLIHGGVYGYPGTSKAPQGKIRLMYEANPMSMLMEQAGGLGTTGTQRILDMRPKNIHQRVPIFLGSRHDIEDLIALTRTSEPIA